MEVKFQFIYKKSQEDMVLFPIRLFVRYLKAVAKNYKELRAICKIPRYKEINFNKIVYPTIFIFVAIPFGYSLFLNKDIDEALTSGFGLAYVLFMLVLIVLFFAFLVFRFLLDVTTCLVCLLGSVFLTIVRMF